MKPQYWVPLVVVGIALSLNVALHDMGTTIVIALVVGAVVGVAMALMSGSSSSQHKAVVAAHPGQEVIEVWGAAGLHQGLRDQGVDKPNVRKTQGTSLSLVLGPDSIELWRGAKPRLILSLPWDDLVGVYPTAGVVAADGPKPAMALVTRQGAELKLCVAAKPTGSLRMAPGATVQALVDKLNNRVSGTNQL